MFFSNVKSYIMPANPHFMVKKMNVGEAPVQPIRRRRAKVDGYEALFLILWLITMVTSFCALLWWASTDSSLFGVVFSSDVEMRRLVFICCVSFWAFCSFSLLRFDALAKTREKIELIPLCYPKFNLSLWNRFVSNFF